MQTTARECAMQRARKRFAAVGCACLVLVLATGLKTGGPTLFWDLRANASHLWDLRASARRQIAPDDEQAIQQLVARFYDARARKDVAAYAALWAAKAPRRVLPGFPAEIVFPYDRLEPGAPLLTRLKQEATSVTARVTVDVKITPKAGDTPRAERWIRNMGFLEDGSEWRVWREAPASEDLAVEIAAARSDEAREALLKSEPDLVTEELAFAIETQADRQWASATPNAKAAMALYQIELRIAGQVKSIAADARCHMKMAQLLQLGSPDAAIPHFQQALEGFKAVNDRERWAKTEMGLATSYYNRDNQAAREHCLRAIDLFEGLKDTYALAGALHNYGNASYLLGDWSAALEAYQRSMALQQAAGSRAVIPALLQAIGRVQKDQGDYDAAIASYQKSLAEVDVLSYATQFGGLSGLGDVYRLQGRFELSLEQYGRALALTRTNIDNQGTMQVEADIGNVYMSGQQPVAARDHYRISLAIAETLANRAGIARALAAIGLAEFSDTQYEAAIQAYTKALPIREALQDKGEMAWLHAHIGLAQSALEKHEEALASHQQAFDLSNALGDRAAVAVMQTLLASEHAELDHKDQALELAERAANLAREIESDDTLARARVVKARVLRKNDDRDGAERALQEAIAAVESGRARAGDEPRNDFFGDTRGPFRAMALLLAENGRAADALVVAERAQIGLLADVLSGNRSLVTNGLSNDEQEEERRLNRQRKSLRVQVQKERDRPTPDAARLASLKTRLADADQQRKAFAEKLYAAQPTLKLRRGLFEASSLERLTAAVTDSKTAVLEFVTTDRQTLVLVLTRKAPAVARTATNMAAASPGPAQIDMKVIDVRLLDLARQVREFRGLIRGREEGVGNAARDLYDLLLQPIHDALAGTTRLVIVPDGPLWSLPFQALRSQDGRYLIQQCAVSYAPSLTALDLLAGSSLAATTPARRLRVVAVANQQAGSAADRLKLLNAAANLAPMPNAELEARSLGPIYGSARAKVYAGRAATQDVIRADTQAAALLHLATFFVPNVASPMRSPIVFSTRKTGEADVVEAWELMRWAMPPVAVVSRVHVDRVGGEGTLPVGLSWVFFVGGTKTAVMATWPDDSPAAVSLMLGLHRNLARPAAVPVLPARALRQAILPLLSTKYRHPFYWANYAVLGIG
jgi:CHAT domain-containing protein